MAVSRIKKSLLLWIKGRFKGPTKEQETFLSCFTRSYIGQDVEIQTHHFNDPFFHSYHLL
jgi:hypothetical protein